MAHQRPVATGEHRRQFPSTRKLQRMPDQKDTPMDAVKRAATQSACDGGATDAEHLQLPGGDETELTPRDPRDCVIWVVCTAAGGQKVTKLQGRDELGDISALRDTFSPRPTSPIDFGQFRTGCAAHPAEDDRRIRPRGRNGRDCSRVVMKSIRGVTPSASRRGPARPGTRPPPGTGHGPERYARRPSAGVPRAASGSR